VAKTYKILLFMKRRKGMDVTEFRDYYETHHVPLVTKGGAGLSHYVRRYIEPLPHPETGDWQEPPFDVITEIGTQDEAAFHALVTAMTTSVMPKNIREDEEKLFDRSSFRIATVVEQGTGSTS